MPENLAPPRAEVAEIRLKAEFLHRYALPDILYPIRASWLSDSLETREDLSLELLLAGLQQRSTVASSEWQDFEPAMARLADLIAGPDDRPVVRATSEQWWLELGPVDLAGTVVTIQRGDRIVAALSGRDDRRLRVAVYRPLDGTSISHLTGLGIHPDPEYGCMGRETNWDYAVDSSHGMRHMYAADAGSAYLSMWEFGVGVLADRSIHPQYHAQRSLTPRRAAAVAMEIGVGWTYGNCL